MTQKLAFSHKRCRVTDVCVAKDVIFALTLSGICVAFDRDSGKRLCDLNMFDDEVIRSLFYNRIDESILTVSVKKSTKFGILSCRSTQLRLIRKLTPSECLPILTTEVLEWPGFVEFDDINEKIITKSSTERCYKLWSLLNYTLLYKIDMPNVQELRPSIGYFLAISKRITSHRAFTLIDARTGQKLKSFQLLTHRQKNLSFVEVYDRFIFIKEEGEDAQIVNIDTVESTKVENSETLVPSAFLYLHLEHLFITFQKGRMKIWDLRHNSSSSSSKQILWSEDRVSSVCTDENQQMLIFCTIGASPSEKAIHVANTRTGERLAVIHPNTDPNHGDAIAFAELSCLAYDNSRKEIIGGGSDGCLNIWSI
eukprot:TRINITY_DN3114_c0_g1_i2.p1 TRINITY_DN3114_c0_g1~~TRINITY_DN3114_c0_g1_i2.p1  ORF type:complete len:367 (-),score=63.75 TRINITY_DN3114_c0_g1_i2:199-1299(-)